MRCRLCLNKRELRKSHIIPEFLYEPLYDSKHRFFRVSTAGRVKRQFEQKGLREYLLCEQCEVKLSRFERYARGVFFGGVPIEILADDPRGLECRVDYQRFKLFQLSLLWRVGVASLSEFKNVVLGKHEKKLRSMLRECRPGETEEYGCILVCPRQCLKVTEQLIMSMGMVDVQDVTTCTLIAGGMLWLFLLSRQAVDPGQKERFLQSDGTLTILLGDFGTSEYLKELATELRAKNPHLFSP